MIPVGILGATGMVGQRLVERLAKHPWFRVRAVAASERSAGQSYADAATWRLGGDPPAEVAQMHVLPCDPAAFPSDVKLVLSSLDTSVAREIEGTFRSAGFAVVSNASAYRNDPDVPLVVPEVNPDHLSLITQQGGPGYIVTNPNCCSIPFALALTPLQEAFGVEAVMVATYQAVSGAGYPGESAWDMVGSVHPHAGNEEDKLQSEPLKIMGGIGTPASFPISARCVRVNSADGHLLALSVKLGTNASPEDVKQVLRTWTGRAPELPSSPRPLFHVTDRRDRPNTRLDVDRGDGMAVAIGRVERCPILGVKLFALAHNTVRGAAGAAIANAELLKVTGRLPA